jgi:hypothetical protein
MTEIDTLNALIQYHQERAIALSDRLLNETMAEPEFMEVCRQRRLEEGKAANFRFKRNARKAGKPLNGEPDTTEINIR